MVLFNGLQLNALDYGHLVKNKRQFPKGLKRGPMDLNQLFRLKEDMLKDLAIAVDNMAFKDEETKAMYYFTSMEAIMDFYTKAMIVIINNESSKKKRAA